MSARTAVIIIAVIAAAVAIYWRQSGGQENKQRPSAPVVALKTYTKTLSDKVQALGTAMSDESIDITATAAETIQEIHFTDGAFVEQGTVILRLEQDEEQAELEAAKARLDEHERELKRLDELLKNKAASRREYDERATLKRVTENEIKQIQARIDDRTLRAPFDGVLGVRRLSVGALVQPGQLITTIDDTDPIKLDFSVPSVYLSQLKQGLPIIAKSDALPGREFTGSIETVNSRVDPVTRSVLVRALLDNKDGTIRPGLLMQVTLLEEQHEAVIVPEESIIQHADDHFVFVLNDDDTAHQQQVQIGVREPGIVEITDGLEAGQTIVVRGMGEISDGDKVTVQDRWDVIKDSQFGNKNNPPAGP